MKTITEPKKKKAEKCQCGARISNPSYDSCYSCWLAQIEVELGSILAIEPPKRAGRATLSLYGVNESPKTKNPKT